MALEERVAGGEKELISGLVKEEGSGREEVTGRK